MKYGESSCINDKDHRTLERRVLHSCEGINEINSRNHEDILGRTENRLIHGVYEDKSNLSGGSTILAVGSTLIIWGIVGYMIYRDIYR